MAKKVGESEAVRQLKKGEISALEEIYRLYATSLLNQCYRILLSTQMAEDAMQEIFINLPSAIKGFRGDSKLGTWLFRICHNHCLQIIRKNKNRRRLLSLQSRRLTVTYSYESIDTLSKALGQLDPETRSMMWMKEGEGMGLSEISAVLNIPEGTIKSRLARARLKIKRWLKEEMNHVG